jgi:glycerol uptake facilitator-like aquaporin
MTLAANIMFFGPLTGASLNPARTIGPALMTGQMDTIVIYSVATILGGVLAGLLFRSVLAED